jgi:hypothetical protein
MRCALTEEGGTRCCRYWVSFMSTLCDNALIIGRRGSMMPLLGVVYERADRRPTGPGDANQALLSRRYVHGVTLPHGWWRGRRVRAFAA